MNIVAKSFFKGLFIVAPMALTLYLVFFVVRSIDGMLNVSIPGVGLLLTLLLITAVGMLASNMLGRKMVGLAESGLAKVPVVKLLYSSLKDLTNAFIGDQKRFRRPVIVDLLPEQNIKVLGFVTCPEFDTQGLTEHVAVYVPQSYAMAGNLLLVPRARVQPLDAEGAQTLAFVVSGGVAGLKPSRKSDATGEPPRD